MIEGGKGRPGNNHVLYNLIKKYSTGWLLNEIGGAGVADWTNVHLGTDPTGDSNVTHGLDGNLADFIVKVLISTDGTDANSFEVALSPLFPNTWSGYTVSYVDANNIKIQTGIAGLLYLLDNGIGSAIAAQNWYYKIIIYKITCKEF